MRIYGSLVRFTIRGPWIPGRCSYSISRDEIDADGIRTLRFVSDKRIIALTLEYKKAKKFGATKGELERLVEIGRSTMFSIKKELETEVSRVKKEKPLSSYNIEIADSYVRRKIQIKTNSVAGSRYTEECDIRRAIKKLGTRSIKTAEVQLIQNILDGEKSKGSNRHLIRAYRNLLRFIGRFSEAEQLRAKKFQEVKPAYLTSEQVDKLVTNIPKKFLLKHPHLGDVIRITFNLGTRISETLALETTCLRKTDGHIVVMVSKQWVRKPNARADGSDRFRATKNRTQRAVLPINSKETVECLQRFLKSHPKIGEEREKYRWAVDNYLRGACKKLFSPTLELEIDLLDLDSIPDLDQNRNYKAVHMLRAAHAVHMMAITGDNSNFVAKQLGDTEQVVREYYAGRTNRPLSIAEVARVIYAPLAR